MTSPLIVILVALAFHIREQSMLLCLGGLQTLLVSAGFGIEREIQIFFNVKQYNSWKSIFYQKGFLLMFRGSRTRARRSRAASARGKCMHL